MAGWNIVITGTSRGIGLELVKHALEKGHRVLAVARAPQESKGLSDLVRQYQSQLQTLAADVSHPETPAKIRDAAQKMDGRVDVLINNAGILLKGESAKDLHESFQVNTIAPFLITQALLPLLKNSSEAKLVNMTSQMGSIADNGSGGYYAYRSSKAALNMINASLTRDNPWLATIVIHPGWVQTDMGGKSATVSTKDSVVGIWKLIEGMRPENAGRFLTYRGQELSW